MRWKLLGLAAVGIVALGSGTIALQAELPAPTGPFAVGRTGFGWVDEARPEPMTDDPADHREVPVEIWYPAVAGTGTASEYFPGLAEVRQGLADSGEVARVELLGLRFIRTTERLDAEPAPAEGGLPLILFSPGNGTNAEFYASLAGDLASHGVIVVAINHPFDVAATRLADGRVAVFDAGPDANRQAAVEQRVAVRTADLLFVLDRLQTMARDGDRFAGLIDFSRVAVIGHSLGGLAAAQACAAAAIVVACGNLDGVQEGGIFAVRERSLGPDQPFLFVTKEAELSPALVALLEERAASTSVVMIANAAHDSFTDGPSLTPSLFPGTNAADRAMDSIRDAVRTFLDQAFAGQAIDLPGRAGTTIRSFPPAL